MRFLQISLLFLLIFSCSSPKTVGFHPFLPETDFIENTYFSDISKDYIYKVKIEVKKHRFGGILIVKKLAEAHFRIVMTTEFGNKLIDFELNKGVFKLNEVVEELNRKFLLNTLHDDFSILTTEKIPLSAAFKNGDLQLLEGKFNQKKLVYSFDKKELQHISRHGIGKNNLKITFEQLKKDLAGKIIIRHPNIKLNIELQYIGE